MEMTRKLHGAGSSTSHVTRRHAWFTDLVTNKITRHTPLSVDPVSEPQHVLSWKQDAGQCAWLQCWYDAGTPYLVKKHCWMKAEGLWSLLQCWRNAGIMYLVVKQALEDGNRERAARVL